MNDPVTCGEADAHERFVRLIQWVSAEREKAIEDSRQTQNGHQSDHDRGRAYAFGAVLQMASVLIQDDRTVPE